MIPREGGDCKITVRLSRKRPFERKTPRQFHRPLFFLGTIFRDWRRKTLRKGRLREEIAAEAPPFIASKNPTPEGHRRRATDRSGARGENPASPRSRPPTPARQPRGRPGAVSAAPRAPPARRVRPRHRLRPRGAPAAPGPQLSADRKVLVAERRPSAGRETAVKGAGLGSGGGVLVPLPSRSRAATRPRPAQTHPLPHARPRRSRHVPRATAPRRHALPQSQLLTLFATKTRAGPMLTPCTLIA